MRDRPVRPPTPLELRPLGRKMESRPSSRHRVGRYLHSCFTSSISSREAEAAIMPATNDIQKRGSSSPSSRRLGFSALWGIPQTADLLVSFFPCCPELEKTQSSNSRNRALWGTTGTHCRGQLSRKLEIRSRDSCLSEGRGTEALSSRAARFEISHLSRTIANICASTLCLYGVLDYILRLRLLQAACGPHFQS
jgi:hypothetical protein